MQDGTRFECQSGEIFNVFDTGKMSFQGKQSTPLSEEVRRVYEGGVVAASPGPTVAAPAGVPGAGTASQHPSPLLSPVKSLLIRSFGWGVGCGLVLITVVGGTLLYLQRPKSWDTHALVVKHAEAGAVSRLNDKLDEVSSGIIFSVDVENKTTADVTLPRTLTTMGLKRGSHSLHHSFLKLDSDYFLPARHIATISLSFDDLCAANYPPQQYFDSYFKDDEFVVIFDESAKYEVLIPVPTLTLPRGG